MTEKEKELQELSYLDEQQLDPEDKELLEEIYNRLEVYEQQNRPYHDDAKKCRLVDMMKDPDQDPHILQLQTLKSTINNVIADQLASMPEGKILPETPDNQEAADDLQDLVHHVMYCSNNYEKIYQQRIRDFYVTGTAITQIAWDDDMLYGKGDVALIRWPIEAFLWDPMAENLQDCRSVMKVSWHPLSWYREHWPDAGRYVFSEKAAHNNVGKPTAQENTESSNDEERALLVEYWWREYNASTKRYTVNVAYAAGQALLEKQKDVYAHGMYPFVIDTHDAIEGTLTGEGLVHELNPMMQYINRYRHYVDTNLRMSSKGRVIIRRQSGIDKEAFADMSQDFVEGDRVVQGEDWNWIQNQPFNSLITNEALQLQTELKQDSGANQFTRGETSGGIVSGKAINSLIQAGGKISNMRNQELNYGSTGIINQILWLMAQFYDDDRVTLVTGRKGMRQIKMANIFPKKTKGSVPPPPYVVQIEVSTRDPQRIANQNQMFMEAYTMAAQAQQFFPLSSLIQILNLDGKDRILPIIQENETYQQQMQALQQQVEQDAVQMENLQKENDNLRSSGAEMANALAQVGASGNGGGFVNQPGMMKEAQAGGGDNTYRARAQQAMSMMNQENAYQAIP